MGEALPVALAGPRCAMERVTGTSRRDASITELFDAHYAGLCRLATLLLDDPSSAEEAVQEAFLRTFLGWRRIRHPERAHAYLRAAVVNQCRSRGRRRRSEQRGNAAVWVATPDHDTAEGAERAPEVLAVLEAVRGLPPRQREAVALRYYADLSVAEVASALRCAPGTVKSQLSKARATLAGALGADDGAGRPDAPARSPGGSGAVEGGGDG